MGGVPVIKGPAACVGRSPLVSSSWRREQTTDVGALRNGEDLSIIPLPWTFVVTVPVRDRWNIPNANLVGPVRERQIIELCHNKR